MTMVGIIKLTSLERELASSTGQFTSFLRVRKCPQSLLLSSRRSSTRRWACETGETAHVERWKNTLRQRLARFVRMTLSFSKSEIMLRPPVSCSSFIAKITIRLSLSSEPLPLDQPSLVFARHARRENDLFMHLGRLFFSTSSISLRNSWAPGFLG